MSCLGASRQWKDEEKQVIAIDLQVGLRGPEKERQAERNAIVQCMLAARQETTP